MIIMKPRLIFLSKIVKKKAKNEKEKEKEKEK